MTSMGLGYNAAIFAGWWVWNGVSNLLKIIQKNEIETKNIKHQLKNEVLLKLKRAAPVQ